MKKLILLTILTICSLNANIIFDLQDQYFENSYKGSSKASLYDLKNSQISMINIYQSQQGDYSTNNSGTIIYKLKDKLKNFTFTTKVKMRSTFGNTTSSIILTSNNGVQHVILFENKKISINDNKFEVNNYHRKTLNIQIDRLGKLFQFKINGQSFMKFDDSYFNALKKIEFTLNDSTYSDELYDFSLMTK